jgi:hypothetical protein
MGRTIFACDPVRFFQFPPFTLPQDTINVYAFTIEKYDRAKNWGGRGMNGYQVRAVAWHQSQSPDAALSAILNL